jgi:hypothetical protein
MKRKRIKGITKKLPVWEQEGSLFSGAKKIGNGKGYDLGTAGLIRSLYNFIKSSPIEPVTKRDKRKNIHLDFIGTAYRFIDELNTECNYEDVAGYYTDWRQDKRSFICERDILDNNYPDYQVLGGKVGVKKQTNRELDKIAKTLTVEEMKNTYESYENERFADLEKEGKLDNYENLEIYNTKNIKIINYYNKEFLNYWKNELVNNINQAKESINYNENKLKNKLKKSEKEESEASIRVSENSIKRAKEVLPKIYYLKDKIFYDYENLKDIINKNNFNLINSDLVKLKELNKKREFINSENKSDYIKLIQYDYDIHNILDNKDIF